MSKNSTRAEGSERAEESDRRGMPLPRTRWAIAGIMMGVIGSSVVGASRGRPGSAEVAVGTVDEPVGTIDGAVRKVSQGVQDASANVRDRFSRARASIRNKDLEAQVKARLLQDRSLDAQDIDVQVENEGTVILKGMVPSTDDKDSAVDLTRDVRGVARVEDHLAVPPAGRVFAAPPDDEPSDVATQPRRIR